MKRITDIPKTERTYWQRVYQKLFIMEYCDDVDQDGGYVFQLLCGALLIFAGIMAAIRGTNAYYYSHDWGLAIFLWLMGSVFFFPALWYAFVKNKDY